MIPHVFLACYTEEAIRRLQTCLCALAMWSGLEASGSFNNYVDEEVVSRKSTLGHVCKGQVVCKMYTIFHSRERGGQNWVKFGPRTQLLNDPLCYICMSNAASLISLRFMEVLLFTILYLGSRYLDLGGKLVRYFVAIFNQGSWFKSWVFLLLFKLKPCPIH